MDKNGIRTEQLSKIITHYFGTDEPRELAAILSDMKRAAMAQELYNGVSEKRKLSDINAQADEIDKSAADFFEKEGINADEMAENPDFMRYIVNNGLSVRDAYYLANRENALNKAKEELTASILSKKDRISENAADSSRARRYLKKRAKELTADEIDDIVNRVRQGERISF